MVFSIWDIVHGIIGLENMGLRWSENYIGGVTLIYQHYV